MSDANRPHAARLHLQQVATLALALLFIVMGWAGVAEFAWWHALGLEPELWWHLIPLALMAVVMLLRIRWPLAALLLGAACVALDLTIGFNLGLLLCLSDLIYSFALRAPRRTVRGMSAALLVIAFAPLALVAVGVDTAAAVMAMLAAMGVLIVPVWWAAEVRRGHPLWQEPDTRDARDAERHAELLRAQAEQRRKAIDAERQQMARELHDVVSSQVSAIALTSGAVLHGPPDTERDRRALETIRRTSVDALDQLAAMVQLLRGSAQGYEELLDEASWQSVLDQAAAHGLSVTVEGELPEQLPSRLRHVVLRVLQESLTNALKHGDGSADVEVAVRGGLLELTVASDPAPEARDAQQLGAGTGLLAMHERVELIGGTLSAGSGPDRERWVVRAALPLEEPR